MTNPEEPQATEEPAKEMTGAVPPPEEEAEPLLPPPRSPSGRLVLPEGEPGLVAGWLGPFLALDRWFGYLELTALILLTAAMIGLGALQVALRNFAATGLDWADVCLRHLTLWAGLLGASATTQAGRHLNVDAFIRLIPDRSQRWAGILLSFLTFLLCLLLTVVSVVFVQQEYQAGGEPLFLGVRRWQAQLIFPLAFALMAYRFFVSTLKGIALGMQEHISL